MRILRRLVRYGFFVTTVTFAGFVVWLVKHPEFAASHGEVRYYALLIGDSLLAVLYGAAYITTWKPSPYRNNWAVAASSLSLIYSIVLAVIIYRFMPGDIRAETPALIVILLGAGGLYLYGRGGSPLKPESAIQPVAPARSIQSIAPAGATEWLPARKIPTTPTPVAPSLVAASSPEFAAAAASPGDPNAAWDPLVFLRTPETFQKLRN
jgi:predicted small integral membrane protein